MEAIAGGPRRLAGRVVAAGTEEASPLHASIYEELRRRMITGKIAPGVTISTRGLAQQLGVSQMPVRDALSRLAAEGAVEIRSKRRIIVPTMTSERLDEIMRCRMLLEPEAAMRALPAIDAATARQLEIADGQVNAALESGDVNDYMENNFRFHFLIYRAAGTGNIVAAIRAADARRLRPGRHGQPDRPARLGHGRDPRPRCGAAARCDPRRHHRRHRADREQPERRTGDGTDLIAGCRLARHDGSYAARIRVIVSSYRRAIASPEYSA
jgi:DNA-binding GntR family transcriptional regulator